jgi:phosphatidylserine/phosphatidylglycerophosphate/cardiolipin synthase-like enzyme
MQKADNTTATLTQIKNAFEPTPIFANEYVDKVVPFIKNCIEEIRIIMFDWRIPEDGAMSRVSIFNDAIFEAVGRGVNVRAIVSSERVKAILEKMGVHAKVWPTDRRLHTKLLILDRFHIVLGSHNLTESAFSHNHELSVFFIVSEFENAFINYFENMWTN